jgi:hypothetical protein
VGWALATGGCASAGVADSAEISKGRCLVLDYMHAGRGAANARDHELLFLSWAAFHPNDSPVWDGRKGGAVVPHFCVYNPSFALFSQRAYISTPR